MRLLLAALVLVFIACGPRATPPILLFAGAGASPNDVIAFQNLLRDNGFAFDTARSSQLNRMSAAELQRYNLLIVPGGNFIDMGNGLTASTMLNIRHAVAGGLNYLGVCAGAFLASDYGYNSINLTSGVRFPFYSAEDQGIRKAAVAITAPGQPTIEHYWEDGPQLTGWGEVVARYPDQTAAVVQGAVGTGFVILSGVHPEAPDNWRNGLKFTTPASAANAYAVTLIRAALHRTPLPHY